MHMHQQKLWEMWTVRWVTRIVFIHNFVMYTLGFDSPSKKNDHVDPHIGLVKSGHMCTVCQQAFNFLFKRCLKLCLLGRMVLPWDNASLRAACQPSILISQGKYSTSVIDVFLLTTEYRHHNHIKVYQEHCKKLDIPLNKRVCPKSNATGTLNRYIWSHTDIWLCH